MTNLGFPMPLRLFHSSGDLMADRRFEFARDLQLKGDLPAAADLIEQALELAPNFTSAWFTLGEIRQQLGERDKAIAAFRKARDCDPGDQHGAMPGAGMVGMTVGDHGPLDRAHRIDVEAAGLAAQTGGNWQQDVLGTHGVHIGSGRSKLSRHARA